LFFCENTLHIADKQGFPTPRPSDHSPFNSSKIHKKSTSENDHNLRGISWQFLFCPKVTKFEHPRVKFFCPSLSLSLPETMVDDGGPQGCHDPSGQRGQLITEVVADMNLQ
jgi:hypothetical protein